MQDEQDEHRTIKGSAQDLQLFFTISIILAIITLIYINNAKGGRHIPLQYILLVLLAVIAVISDFKTCRIKNSIIMAFITAGLLTNYLTLGIHMLAGCALAMVIPILTMIVFFALKMLGAGDIKLFCAIGSIGGVGLVLSVMAYSFIAGGIMACIIMLVNRSFVKRGKYLACYLKSCYLTRSLQPYSDFDDKYDGTKFRFSYAIFCGTAIELVIRSFPLS